MDPLTITNSVLTTTGVCLGAAKRLYGIADRYRHASMTIAAIYSQSMVIGASLQQMQRIIDQNEDAYLQQFRSQPDLSDVFEAALLGCSLVYSCLDDEVQRLRSGINDANEVSWLTHARLLWKEDTMKELLQSIQAQNTAITLLLQCLQVETVSSMQKTLEDVRSKVAGINDLVVTSASHRPGVAEALLQGVSIPTSAHSQMLPLNDAEDDASILGLAPSTKFQSPRHSILSNVSAGSSKTTASDGVTRPPSLTTDLLQRLSKRLSDPYRPEDAPPVPVIPSTFTSTVRRLPQSVVPLPEIAEVLSFSAADVDEGYESHAGPIDESSTSPSIPPVAATSNASDRDYQQYRILSNSDPRKDLQRGFSEQGRLRADTTSEFNNENHPHGSSEESRGMTIEQAVDRFLSNLRIMPAATADVHLQAAANPSVAPSPVELMSSESEPSSPGIETPPYSTSAAESVTAEHESQEDPQYTSISAPLQPDLESKHHYSERGPLACNFNEAVDRVLRSNSRTHIRVASVSSTKTTLPKSTARATLAVVDEFGVPHSGYNG